MKVVFQNVSGDGTPTLRGALIGTAEVKSAGERNIRAAFPQHDHYFHGGLGLSWARNRFTLVEEPRPFRLHRSGAAFGLRGFSPTRYALVVELLDRWYDRSLTVIVTHWVDSAWEASASHPRLRKRLWRRSQRIVKRVVERARRRGRVLVLGDFNRGANADIGLGLDNLAGRGLDRIQGAGYLVVGNVVEGAKTGTAGHTHRSLSVRVR